jgi:predicted house-cleaning noncanonical NTP pyrophosphatase (MazG superfamily)
MTSGKLNIKEEMRAIDCRDKAWYDSLTEEEQAQLSMWQLMRWVSSTDSKVKDINYHYLTMTNDLVNVHFNVLRKHPQLQHQLMQLIGLGTTQYHSWIKPAKKFKGEVNNKLLNFLSELYPSYNQKELELLARENTVEEITDLAESMGMSKKEVKELFK